MSPLRLLGVLVLPLNMLRPTVPVTFYYSSDHSETDEDGFEIGYTSAVISRLCLVDSSGGRSSGETDSDQIDSWEAEVAWLHNEGETDTSGMKLKSIVIDGLTLYPTSDLPHDMGVGGFRRGTNLWRRVRASRTERGRA